MRTSITASPDISRSPEPFIGGNPTSSNPTSPLPTPVHEGGLRARMTGALESAAALPRRMGLPQAAAAVRDASVTHALGAVLREAVAPATSLIANVVATVAKGTKQSLRAPGSSRPLQAALAGNLAQPADQMRAHGAALAYGQHSAKVLDRMLPFLHSAARIGVAGTSMAFGLGRNSGLAAGDALSRLERGAPQAGGVISGHQAPSATQSSASFIRTAASGIQPWLLGAATGAAGNLAGQFLVGPLVNLIPRQFQPIDARAVVPDETVALMNTLKAGAGNELRDQVKASQAEISNIASASNVQLGQVSFDAVTAGRFAAQSATPLGVAGQVSIGLAVSATAGALIGSVMAVRQAVATAKIPDADALRAAVNEARADGPAALAAVPTHELPLFFAKHTASAAPRAGQGSHDVESLHVAAAPDAAQREQATQARSTVQRGVAAMAEVGKFLRDSVAVPGSAVKQAIVASPLLDPLPATAPGTQDTASVGRALATASNVMASGVHRFALMARSTAVTSGVSTASAMLANTTDGLARRGALAIGNAVGIHAAIKPWFNALARDIPAGDNAIRAQRRDAVEAQASRATQA